MKTKYTLVVISALVLTLSSCEDEGGMGGKNKPPDKPYNPIPANGEVILRTDTVFFSWLCSDPDGDLLKYGILVFRDTLLFANLVGQASGLTTPRAVMTNLSYNRKYLWIVFAYDSKDTTIGDIWTFRTRISPQNLTVYSGIGSTNAYTYNNATKVVQATWTIANTGIAGTTGPFRVGLYLSTNTFISTYDYLIATARFDNGLQAGYYAVINYPPVDLDYTGVPYGTYYVGVIVDDLDQVEEWDEWDNAFYFTTPFTYARGLAKSGFSISSHEFMPRAEAASNIKGPVHTSSAPVLSVNYKK